MVEEELASEVCCDCGKNEEETDLVECVNCMKTTCQSCGTEADPNPLHASFILCTECAEGDETTLCVDCDQILPTDCMEECLDCGESICPDCKDDHGDLCAKSTS